MKKLTIIYFIIAATLSILTAVLLQLNLHNDYNLLLIPFLVFLFVYGVMVLYHLSREKRKTEALISEIDENIAKTNEWKYMVKDAHYSKVEELQNDIVTQKKSYDHELEKAEILHEQEIESLKLEHKQVIEKTISEFQEVVHGIVQERNNLLPYKDIVEECGTLFGTNANGIKERIREVENLLSSVVSSMNGVQYERYVGYRLKTEGWKEIEFTPVSGDYGADILGIDPDGNRACVQCKCYGDGTAVGSSAVSEIIGAKSFYHCEKAYVCTTHTATKQAENFASETGVIIRIIK